MNSRIEKLSKFLSESPNDPFLHHALALEYIKEGLDEQATHHFYKNINDSPQYVATYYHLGKLLERAGTTAEAIDVYERGMLQARSAGDMHSYNELQTAHEDLAY
jgi:tetratricopeptide (TPR) repeat protein